MQPPTTPKQVRAFLGLVGFYQKFIKNFAKIAKLLTLSHQTTGQVWLDTSTPCHLFNPERSYNSSTNTTLPWPKPEIYSLHWCIQQCLQSTTLTRAQWHRIPIAFLSHTFTETQCKWSTTEQEAYGVYYAVTKWNYYLQGTNVTVCNDHKPLARFLNGKNANNKVNWWNLELASYNFTFEWISGAKTKAADCLSRLVEHTPQITTPVNMLTVTQTDGPAFHT